jgi:adenylosuccinate lyase
LNKLLLNQQAITFELNNHWTVVAEGIQTILRREKYAKPYEALKEFTRANDEVTEQSIHRFIDTLHLSNAIKDELKAITPQNYTGI